MRHLQGRVHTLDYIGPFLDSSRPDLPWAAGGWLEPSSLSTLRNQHPTSTTSPLPSPLGRMAAPQPLADRRALPPINDAMLHMLQFTAHLQPVMYARRHLPGRPAGAPGVVAVGAGGVRGRQQPGGRGVEERVLQR